MTTTSQTAADFGELLKSLRTSRGLTQRGLAKELAGRGEDVTDRSVSHWEVGRFKPDRRYVLILEDILEAQGVLLSALGLGGREDGVDRLGAIEARIVAIEAHLGIDGADLTSAIEADPHLDETAKAALLRAYRSGVTSGRRRSAQRS